MGAAHKMQRPVNAHFAFGDVNVLFQACAWAVFFIGMLGMGGGPPWYACRFSISCGGLSIWICSQLGPRSY